jgi:type VI secretion system protein ImpC
MSAGEKQQASQAQGEAGESFLEAAIQATKQTERSQAEDLIRTLAEEALKGTVTYNKDVVRTLKASIKAIDEAVSTQLAAIMHTEKFQKLEGSWRGLSYLVMNSETGESLKIRVLNCSKKDLQKDLEKAVEFDQSQLWKKIYTSEIGTPGGKPFGALIGDYEFTQHPDDVNMLRSVSGVAAASFCPFITASAPKMFGMEAWTKLPKPRDLKKIFEAKEYIPWQSFRDSEDSRFVVLTMPRTLARAPYGKETKPTDDSQLDFEEVELGKGGKSIAVAHDKYCWMNTAYVMGTRLTESHSKTGFCTSIRGATSGGKVGELPVHTFHTEDGDQEVKCPTEIAISDRREKEISDVGFLPLCYYKDTDYAVFFGAQTTQKSKKYDRPAATENAQIMARLPYIMATSRFAHFLKVMARDWIGSQKETADLQKELDRWIHNYVTADPNASEEERAKFPLREAKIEVQPVPGQSGSYNAVAWLRPWLQMEELTTSLRMVARIPQTGG